jgi:hypothetical protein
MAPVGFKQYSERDRYAARRTVNKTANLVWKIVVTGIVIAGIVYAIKFLMPLQNELNTAINHPPAFKSQPSFWK